MPRPTISIFLELLNCPAAQILIVLGRIKQDWHTIAGKVILLISFMISTVDFVSLFSESASLIRRGSYVLFSIF